MTPRSQINDAITLSFEHSAVFQGIPYDEAAYDAESDSDDEDDDSTYDLDTRYDAWFSNQETPTRPPSPEHEPDYSYSNPETRVGNRIEDDETSHILLRPWSQSFPVELKSHLDRVDAENNRNLDASNSGSPCGTCDLEPSHPTSTSASDGSDPKTIPPSQELRDQNAPHHCYTVSAEQLNRLQKCISHVEKFHDSVLRSIKDVKTALNRRKDRYRLAAPDGDFSKFMKSRGLGSPLVDVIVIDDGWPDTEWDTPVWKPSRKKIYHGTDARTRVGPPAVGI
ncbi:hypothetical protein G7Z17_g9372 [Cylindrodendrum hubeiense]|uniref:Uncharacterized protein n=1 Tax=Cylindrodendrum hubeiense TaxID=595255 RepID=A0A9P5H6W6_9HYPO|nr:hypothetical protein G7Z17_g9372 [Cylindrodendrum hubeiense]